jgi:15-cis-phytoene synthase
VEDERAGRHDQATATPEDAAAEVAAAARAGEPDRYLAALLAPEPQRRALLALAAFSAELARIPHRAVREPFMGEIRLQWWREALGLSERLSEDPVGNAAAGEASGHPGAESTGHSVADAMRRAARTHALPAALLGTMIDARALELVPVPFEDTAALYDFLWKTEGVLFALAGRVLGLGPSPDLDAASAAAGRAYGMARLLVGLPRSLSLGRLPLAQAEIAAAGLTAEELLASTGGAKSAALLQTYVAQIRGNLPEARGLVHRLPRRARLPFLPLALVGPYVRMLERRGGAALREEVEIVPLTRVWRVATAHLLGRP